MSVVDGLISGLNTTQIIQAIMSTERLPVARLQTKSDDADKKLQAWTDINRTLGTLRTNAQALARSTTFSQSVATSSDTTLATVTAQANTRAAAVSFKVQQLATAHSVMTHGSIGAASKLTL